MGRASTFLRLSTEQNSVADVLIRRYRYAQIDVVRTALQQQGISISRSALGRYMKKLRESDGALMDANEATVLTIMERSTGKVAVVKSPASLKTLLAHVQDLSQAGPIC